MNKIIKDFLTMILLMFIMFAIVIFFIEKAHDNCLSQGELNSRDYRICMGL